MKRIILYAVVAASLAACTPAQMNSAVSTLQGAQPQIQAAIAKACEDVNAASALAAPFAAIPQVGGVLTFATASCAGANAVAALATKALADPTTVTWAENLAAMLRADVASMKRA